MPITDSSQIRIEGMGRRIMLFPYSSARVAKTETLAGCRRHQQEQHWTVPQITNEAVTYLLEASCDIRTVQELLGHSVVRTPNVYTHGLNRDGRGVQSSADRLLSGVGDSRYGEWNGG